MKPDFTNTIGFIAFSCLFLLCLICALSGAKHHFIFSGVCLMFSVVFFFDGHYGVSIHKYLTSRK